MSLDNERRILSATAADYERATQQMHDAAGNLSGAADNYRTAARRLGYARTGYLIGMTFWIIGAAMHLVPRWL